MKKIKKLIKKKQENKNCKILVLASNYNNYAKQNKSKPNQMSYDAFLK